MFKLRYYCQGEGKEEIRKLLTDVKKKHSITYEISDLSRNRTYDEEKEKQVYERDFKPRAKVLKERTCEPITQLRSRKARHYFISLPGTITIIGNEVQFRHNEGLGKAAYRDSYQEPLTFR